MQGKVKTKVQVPGNKGRNKQRHVHQKKSMSKKKGRVIAPKKAKHLQMAKLKKNMEKAIGSNIEQEILSKAAAQEPRSMTVVTNPSPKVSQKKKNKKK
ncbi:UPF0390 protein zgc136864-like [Amphiura filiformis]|uniref:UPF0390 protein zgc136864-like n=1 Tax=Amphiura filiformis TaxID=82378 RepID=UPI003B21F85D